MEPIQNFNPNPNEIKKQLSPWIHFNMNPFVVLKENILTDVLQ